MKPESRLIKGIHRHLPDTVYAWKINTDYQAGVPDCWYSGREGDVWVEYKWLPTEPVRQFTARLSPMQARWLDQRDAEGRIVAVGVGCPTGVMLLRTGAWNSPVCQFTWWTRARFAEWITAQTGR